MPSDMYVSKKKIEVTVFLTDDNETLHGFVFPNAHQRVLDLMVDPIPFLPFEHESGQFLVINKQTIRYLQPIDTVKADPIQFGIPETIPKHLVTP